MPSVTSELALTAAPSVSWLRRELAPFPGRLAMTLRLVVAVTLVTIVSMALETPLTAFSAYMVFFATKPNRFTTMFMSVGLAVGSTVGITSTLFFYRYTFDHPELRIPAMALAVFGGMFFSRILTIGPLAFAGGFVLAITQTMAESFRDADGLVRGLLWLWVVVVLPAGITVLVAQAAPATGQPNSSPATAPAGPTRRLLVPDAFSNPNHIRFGLKVALAATSCYVIYSALDWPGIRTAFVTCYFIALESTEATLRKARLRLAGCLIGGALGFLAIMYLIPRMESIVTLVLLTAAGAAIAGWVAAGSERIAYAGLQIAFAFFLCIFQGLTPDTDFDTIRNRIVGIVLGITVTAVVFRHLWPQGEAKENG